MNIVLVLNVKIKNKFNLDQQLMSLQCLYACTSHNNNHFLQKQKCGAKFLKGGCVGMLPRHFVEKHLAECTVSSNVTFCPIVRRIDILSKIHQIWSKI